jgi:hypothetical protein
VLVQLLMAINKYKNWHWRSSWHLFIVSFTMIMLHLTPFTATVFGQAPKIEPGKFTIARVKYGGGGDWYSNPTSIPNLLSFLSKRTGVFTAKEETVVELSSHRLFSYSYLYLNGHGNISFTEREVQQLRRYFELGGFLHADDNYGMDASFRREMKRVLPNSEFTELPFNHPIYSSHFKFTNGPPKIHEHDGKPAQGLSLFLDGKMVVFYTYQSDLGDGWEDEGVHNDPSNMREDALKMGSNIVIWRLRGGQ